MILAFNLTLAYFLGSIPTGLLVAFAAKGVDIRRHGSKNIGATNVFRVAGKGWGILVLILDALKGYLAVISARFIHPNPAAFPVPIPLALGIAAILGHSFSVWLSFKGGKGVATSLGVFLAIIPATTLLTLLLWSLIFAAGRIISLASIIAAAGFPFMIYFTAHTHPYYQWLLPIACILAIFIGFTHRKNIGRLIRGEEKKLF